jgi:hypothetical protein
MPATIKERFRKVRPAADKLCPHVVDDIYLPGRSGEDVMQYDYARTVRVAYDFRGLMVGCNDWRGDLIGGE